jgi:replicative DNA helicase
MSFVEAGNYAEDGANVMYFTIEMPFNPLRRRVDSCLAGVPLYGLRDGRLTEAEERQYEACLKFQENYSKEFYIVDIPRGCTVSQIEAKYMEMLYEFQPQLIVVDYISLMKLDNDESQDWLNVGHLAEMLHEFARTYEVPCITPVQLNRPKQGVRELPDQHRVGRSIMVTQNCNILLNIDTRPDENTQQNMVINIAKMRDGEKGSFTLHKRLDMMRVTDDIQGWSTEDYEIQE